MVYQPSPLVLRGESTYRKLLSGKILDEERDAYDESTYLFDAVRIEDDPKILMMGPPLLNLKRALGKPSISISGRTSRYTSRKTAYGRFTEWDVSSPDSLVKDETLSVQFPKGGHYDLGINRITPFPPGSRILTAIQKNNKIRWVLDWFDHYRTYHGVQYLVLYDNGSDNLEELVRALPDEAVIIDWRFPYGPPGSHDNKFSQIGALNHCRKTFGRDSIIYSLDIDELLVDAAGESEDLVSRFNTVYYSSYFVPHLENAPEDYSFGAYSLRRNKPLHHARKYIYHASESGGVLPHYVQSRKRRLFSNSAVFLRKVINNRLRKFGSGNRPEIRLAQMILKAVPGTGREYEVPITRGYFLHFLGITTGWKITWKRTQDTDTRDCIPDPFMDREGGNT